MVRTGFRNVEGLNAGIENPYPGAVEAAQDRATCACREGGGGNPGHAIEQGTEITRIFFFQRLGVQYFHGGGKILNGTQAGARGNDVILKEVNILFGFSVCKKCSEQTACKGSAQKIIIHICDG